MSPSLGFTHPFGCSFPRSRGDVDLRLFGCWGASDSPPNPLSAQQQALLVVASKNPKPPKLVARDAITTPPLTSPHRRDGKTTSHKRSFKNSHLHTALKQRHAGPKPPPITLLAQNPHQDVFGQASTLISCRQGRCGESWKSFLDEPSSLSSLRPHTSHVEALTTSAQPNPYGGL